jgi:hypothetical protein
MEYPKLGIRAYVQSFGQGLILMCLSGVIVHITVEGVSPLGLVLLA